VQGLVSSSQFSSQLAPAAPGAVVNLDVAVDQPANRGQVIHAGHSVQRLWHVLLSGVRRRAARLALGVAATQQRRPIGLGARQAPVATGLVVRRDALIHDVRAPVGMSDLAMPPLLFVGADASGARSTLGRPPKRGSSRFPVFTCRFRGSPFVLSRDHLVVVMRRER
jgi:hypothetical protein